MMRWNFPTVRLCWSRIFAKVSARRCCSFRPSRKMPMQRHIRLCRKRDLSLTGSAIRRRVERCHGDTRDAGSGRGHSSAAGARALNYRSYLAPCLLRGKAEAHQIGAHDDAAGKPARLICFAVTFSQAYTNLPQAAAASGSMAARFFCLTLFMARSIGRTVNSSRSSSKFSSSGASFARSSHASTFSSASASGIRS